MSKKSFGRQISRLIWLAKNIGGHTRAEINALWREETSLNESEEDIIESSFHRWKKDVEDLFDINIECDKTEGRRYYFAESFVEKQSKYHRWLIDSFYISNLMKYSRELQSQIMFEPMENRFLTDIIEAMRDHRVLQITHQSFGRKEPSIRTVKPYGLKQFRQRWYMVAQVKEHDNQVFVYALDRITNVERTGDSYKIPTNFNIEEYFANIYGVTIPKRKPGEKPEKIVIKINDEYQANYLRTLQLHPTQENLGDNTFQFTLFLADDDDKGYTEDFYRELRAYGPKLEVLEPEWLRKKFLKEAKDLVEVYRKKK